jgi:hypothetical protein
MHNTQKFNVETQMGENHGNILLKYIHRKQPVTDTNLLQCLQAPT